MDVLKKIMFLFSGIGAINGLILALYYIFVKKNKTSYDIIFGFLLLSLTVRIGKSVYLYFIDSSTKIILQIGLSFGLLIGPLLFFFSYFLILKSEKITPLFYWITGLAALSIILTGIIIPYQEFAEYWNNYIIYMVYFIWFVGLLGSTFLSIKNRKLLFELPTVERNWFLIVLLMNLVIFFFYQAALLFHIKSYIYGPMTFSLGFYLLTYLEFKRVNVSKKHAKSVREVDEAFAQKVFLACASVMEAKELYKNPRLKLQELAAHAGYKPHDVSFILNIDGQSFADFVNSYRVSESKRLIATRSDLTMEGIGYESGFSSKSSFYAVFKKITGKTPSSFIISD